MRHFDIIIPYVIIYEIHKRANTKPIMLLKIAWSISQFPYGMSPNYMFIMHHVLPNLWLTFFLFFYNRICLLAVFIYLEIFPQSMFSRECPILLILKRNIHINNFPDPNAFLISKIIEIFPRGKWYFFLLYFHPQKKSANKLIICLRVFLRGVGVESIWIERITRHV